MALIRSYGMLPRMGNIAPRKIKDGDADPLDIRIGSGIWFTSLGRVNTGRSMEAAPIRLRAWVPLPSARAWWNSETMLSVAAQDTIGVARDCRASLEPGPELGVASFSRRWATSSLAVG